MELCTESEALQHEFPSEINFQETIDKKDWLDKQFIKSETHITNSSNNVENSIEECKYSDTLKLAKSAPQNGSEKFKCHICDEEFDQYSLEVHFVTSHSLEEDDENDEDFSETTRSVSDMKLGSLSLYTL